MQAISQGESLLLQGVVLALALLSLGLSWWGARVGSPIISIFGRWARWFFIASLVAAGVHLMGWSGHGPGVLALVSLLLWFIVETGYNWLAINALSKSELPLFPKFEENEKGEEWPSSRQHIRLKDWLRKQGFVRKQALVSHLGDLTLMRISVYENPEATIRLQVVFLPNLRGGTSVCLSCYSSTRSGDLLVTDNVFLPFGGFYPENWDVERSPWTRSPGKLLHRHEARIDARAEPLIPIVHSPLEQINGDQRVVEQLNRDLGFLHQPAEQEELGRLTPAGRARIWQEIWTLSYLGLPLKYN
ncbi:MAG: hypothetical protein ACO3ZW_02480 [Opitutales bacterium]